MAFYILNHAPGVQSSSKPPYFLETRLNARVFCPVISSCVF